MDMISNNIIIILVIICVVGIIVYFYYNQKSDQLDQRVSKWDKYYSDNPAGGSSNKKNRSVKFSDKVQYNEFSNCSSLDLDSDIPTETSINVDQILSDISGESKALKEKFDTNTGQCDRGGNGCSISETEGRVSKSKIQACNTDQTNPDDSWDSNFGLPLMNTGEKNKYFTQMKKNHDKLVKSLSEFTDYQMDSSTIIKTDTTINQFDPFNPNKPSKKLKGKKVSEIYDEQVEGPKFKSKKIIKKTPAQIFYDKESELNGGELTGSSLHGYNGVGDEHQGADFGNGFSWKQPQFDLTRPTKKLIRHLLL
jgi:hypothetical protein